MVFLRDTCGFHHFICNCILHSSQLIHINTVCTTPEKMAIVLLDYLFSQETQAKSNLSGKGKHFKEQLDPLKVGCSVEKLRVQYLLIALYKY